MFEVISEGDYRRVDRRLTFRNGITPRQGEWIKVENRGGFVLWGLVEMHEMSFRLKDLPNWYDPEYWDIIEINFRAVSVVEFPSLSPGNPETLPP